MRLLARTLVLAGVAAALNCTMAQAQGLPKGEALPNADTILDRYVQVTGGKAAYAQHKTEILTGTVGFPEQGLTGQLTRYAAAPDQEYSIVEINPIGAIESGVLGGVAWEKTAILGPRVKSGEEKDQAIREARFNAAVEWRTIYPKVETVGVETIDGDPCYKVKLTPTIGKPESQFFSVKSGLLLRTTATAASQMGDIEVEVNVSDYKSFGGVLVPTRSRQKAGGQELVIQIDQVRVNEAIPAAKFDLPPEIKTLLLKGANGAATK